MTGNDVLKNLSEYNIWANQTMLDVFSSLPSVPNNAARLFSHALNAQAIWIARITGTQSPVKVWQEHNLEELKALHQSASYKIAELVANADETEFNRLIDYTNSLGQQYSTRVLDILTHAFNHATYHRAQTATDLRNNGHTPPNTDYVTYVRELMGQVF
ncbi:DinB family protein [Pontibacter arcticus]|uniref:Damage-inducible protein DinB n=1 Tax=Pontibacter arcticus TaxID=2080288 RepID=A0A364RIY7_9BACT|nr:DinB family protein [Pontibacter arcticus]RAU84267.1 damage-inducible protein DinB [Pontibacter arcticus]